MNPFIEMLNEPKNTLGRTEEAVEMVLSNPALIDQLYECYFQPDEWVRLRTSSSFKRIWRADESLFEPFIEGFVADVSKIDQPSVNWTFAQMCLELSHLLSASQRKVATKCMKKYLETSDDWIVQNSTIETLGSWSEEDPELRAWLLPQLQGLAKSLRKSVAKRATKWLTALSD